MPRSRSRSLQLAVGTAAVALCGGALALAFSDGTSPRPVADSARAGCVDRVEGGFVAPTAGSETVIGPVAWPRLVGNYRRLVASGDLGPPPGTDYPYEHYPLKALALVKADTTVTLTVPREQRSYLRLLYGDERVPKAGLSEVTLAACRRSQEPAAQAHECRWEPHNACRRAYTQFSGGFRIDFDRAPRRGLCSELVVREHGESPRRARLFAGASGECA